MATWRVVAVVVAALVVAVSPGHAWRATSPAQGLFQAATGADSRAVTTTVKVDDADGSYSVLINGSAWFVSAPTRLHVNGQWYSSHPSQGDELVLKLTGAANRTAADILGEYKAMDLTWVAGNTTMVTSIRAYTRRSAVVFEQFFPDGAWGMQQGVKLTDLDKLSSSFPTFQVAGTPLDTLPFFGFRYFWDLDMGGVGLKQLGAGGLYGGSPLMIYNNTESPMLSAVLSPLKNFKVGFQSMPARLQGAIGCGVHGRLKWVPRRFTHQTLLSVGTGVNRGMEQWGDLMMLRYGKRRYSTTAVPSQVQLGVRQGGVAFDDSITSPARTHLGYITDTGAYYWYNTEPGKNYQQTMLDIKAYHTKAGVPVGWYEMDSWWYVKDTTSGEVGGIKLYEAKPSVFPNGMAWMAQQLDTPIACHAKYYSANNDYQTDFPFMIEPNASIPLTVDFWDFIMSQGASWGMTVWKQDWLASIYELMVGPSEDVYTARNFHLHMAAAANAAGLEMEYCMPVVSDVLESLENPAARYIRLSDDYSTNPLQWHIGRVGIVSWAIGLAPFKDTFWTTSVQPGNKINFTEPNPELNAAVASLSTAQVGIGDAIGKTNMTVVRRTCMADGRLLRTDRPATAIDATFKAHGAPQGEVWHTTSQITTADTRLPPAIATHFVLGANLTAPYPLTVEDLGIGVPTNATFATTNVRWGITPTAAPSLSGPGGRLVIPACPVDKATGVVPWHLYCIAPVLPNDWALLGEPDKYVPVSSQRFSNLRMAGTTSATAPTARAGTQYPTGVCVDVTGVANESVTVVFATGAAALLGDMQALRIVCSFDNTGGVLYACGQPTSGGWETTCGHHALP